ncbi:O-antigen ligase family protein [Citromicrobium bathyomarinum]|uniref:O-antigen ligase family protein n=1 Tax=Sphingomonadales TaxID=204457 RepID=UPI001A3D999C|nr:O-antigen ligase family protein [Citromicrobium sp.]
MAKRETRIARLRGALGDNWRLATLCVLLGAAFLLGGGSRGDILSLIILRPLAVVCLGLGLFGMTRHDWRAFRVPLAIMGAIVALILLHLIPLPPVIWSNLPGREIVVRASELAGLEGVWRPISMVPYRGWNAFYAMLVPAAAMVLAVQVPPQRQKIVLYVVLAAMVLAAFLGIAQAGSGYNPATYPYRLSNFGSPVGLFSNRNHFSALMCIAIPALALIATRAPASNRMLVHALCAGGVMLAVFMILATGSRAGLVLSGVGFLTAWLIWSARPARVKRRQVGRTWIVPAVAVGFFVVVAACLAVIFDRAEALDRISTSSVAEENRVQTWQVTAESLPDYMPVGSGIGSFKELFQIHEPASMLGFAYWNHAHNDWLEWLLEGGVPALLLMLFAVWAFARSALYLWRHRGSDSSGVRLGMFGGAAILILGLWSFVDYPLRVPSMACLAAIAAVWMTAPRVSKPSFARNG